MSACVRPGLRFGLSRHCSVVTTSAGAVDIDRAAFEHPVGAGRRQAGGLREPLADVLVAVEVVFVAPAVEAEACARRGCPSR